jgi:hypothetical protein
MSLTGALLGTTALVSVSAAATPAGMGHPPLRQFATLPSPVRVRRRTRGAKRRAIAWWNDRRPRQATRRISAESEAVQPRLVPHDSDPRGPPRSAG